MTLLVVVNTFFIFLYLNLYSIRIFFFYLLIMVFLRGIIIIFAYIAGLSYYSYLDKFYFYGGLFFVFSFLVLFLSMKDYFYFFVEDRGLYSLGIYRFNHMFFSFFLIVYLFFVLLVVVRNVILVFGTFRSKLL